MGKVEQLSNTYTVVFNDGTNLIVSGQSMDLYEYAYYIYRDKKMEEPVFVSIVDNIKYIVAN